MALDYILLRRVANQSIVSASISWDTEDSDVAGYFTIAVPTKITIPTGKGGKFLVCFTYNWASQITSRAFSEITVRNSSDVAQYNSRAPLGYDEGIRTHTVVLVAAATDYFTASVWQPGSAINCTARLEVLRLGA